MKFYSTGCVLRAAQSWWELSRQDPQILRLPDERTNILMCVDECFALKHWEWVARFWDLTEELYNLGYWEEYERLDRHCLVAAQKLGKVEMETAIYNELGWLTMEKGLLPQAREFIQVAYDLYTQQGNLRGQLISRRYFATLAMTGQEWESARQQLEELLELLNNSLEQGDSKFRDHLRQQTVTVHDSLGIVLQQLNDDLGAERELQLGLEGAPTRGPLAVANSVLNLGKLRIKQGRHSEAHELLDQCLKICQAGNYRALEAAARYHLAKVAQSQGEIQTGIALARESWKIYQSLGASTNAIETAELISSMLVGSGQSSRTL